MLAECDFCIIETNIKKESDDQILHRAKIGFYIIL